MIIDTGSTSLRCNHGVLILLINTNYIKNKNLSYTGKIDKSVTKYLRTIEKEALDYYPEHEQSEIAYTKSAIKAITERLNLFMAKTSEKTTLFLDKQPRSGHNYFIFINKKIGAAIRGWAAPAVRENAPMVGVEGVNISMQDFPRTKYYKTWYTLRQHRNNYDIRIIDKWSKELVEKVNPEDVDKGLELRAKTCKKPMIFWED